MIESRIEGRVDELVQKLVMGAFTTNKGKFDQTKINRLRAMRNNSVHENDEEFLKALDMIEAAKKPTKGKCYYRVYLREDDGSYNLVVLNLNG